MLRSLHSELLKIATTRAWWLLALILFVWTGFNAGVIAALGGVLVEESGGMIGEGSIPPLVYSTATSVGYVFPLLFGALASTSEARHQTLTPTFLATPRRGIVLGGKIGAGIVWGAVFGIVGLVAAAGLGGLILQLVGVDPGFGSSDTWALIGRALLAMALWAVIGVGLGVLMPNQVAVIVTVLAFTQFLEPLLRLGTSFWEWTAAVGRFLPGAATDALVGSSIYSLVAGGAADALEWWQGGLVLAGYAALFLAIGGLTTWRRDVT
ncbi:ABC transporter permease [Protaetiibacter sp. SSC-01]|uniref:ABC transporter permease n=1 Tax=Protaetiibacter sp. SSC-01 TaxID=2759943 RepID=UPI001656B867|nr:ABC transporter permease [Protaetiibacter sp. SSC-01]QNO38487.1 ABC transporter permease [Protaetiibacter sp. SSC-01]